MHLDQMILRPEPKLVLIQHLDQAGRSGVTMVPLAKLTPAQAEAFGTLLALGQDQLPAEPDDPAVAAIKTEIATLEARLEVLRSSLAGAAPVEMPVEELKPAQP